VRSKHGKEAEYKQKADQRTKPLEHAAPVRAGAHGSRDGLGLEGRHGDVAASAAGLKKSTVSAAPVASSMI